MGTTSKTPDISTESGDRARMGSKAMSEHDELVEAMERLTDKHGLVDVLEALPVMCRGKAADAGALAHEWQRAARIMDAALRRSVTLTWDK